MAFIGLSFGIIITIIAIIIKVQQPSTVIEVIFYNIFKCDFSHLQILLIS